MDHQTLSMFHRQKRWEWNEEEVVVIVGLVTIASVSTLCCVEELISAKAMERAAEHGMKSHWNMRGEIEL